MASGTILFPISAPSSQNTYVQGRIIWSEFDQTTSGDPPLTSKVKCTIQVKKGSDSVVLTVPTTGVWNWSMNINGSPFSGSIQKSVLLDWVTLASDKTVTVTHDEQTGEKTIAISGSVSAPSISSLTYKTSSGSQNVSLDKLYVRNPYNPSTISVSPASARMGDAVSFTITRQASELTHTIEYSYGSFSGTIATGVGTSYSWTIPNLLQYGTSGNATITCKTYNGSTLIGSSTTTLAIQPYSAATIGTIASSIAVGGTLSIPITSNASYSNKLYYRLNAGSYADITQITGSGTYNWTVPSSLVSQMVGGDTLTIKVESFYSNTKIGENTKSCGLTVSTPTTPSISPSSVVMGNVMTINLSSRLSPSMTHTITYAFNGGTGTIATKTGDASVSWTVPYSLAASIPTATSGSGQITVTTYLGNTQIGSQTSVNFTATVPNVDEVLPNFSYTITKVQPSGLPASMQNLLIQQVSKLRCQFSNFSSSYSTFDHYALNIEGEIKTGADVTSEELQRSGSILVSAQAYDKRGYFRSYNEAFNVTPYNNPKVLPSSGRNDIIIERSTSAGIPDEAGTYLHIIASVAYSPLTVGGSNLNSVVFQYRTKLSSASWQGDEVGWNTIAFQSGTLNINATIGSVISDITKEYTVQVRAVDSVPKKHIVTVTISAESTPLHLAEGGKGIGLGMMNSGDGIDIGWETRFHTGIKPMPIFEVPSSSNGWIEKHYLNDDIPSADSSLFDKYNLFLITVQRDAFFYPVLCYRVGAYLFGSLSHMSSDTTAEELVIEITKTASGLYLSHAKTLIHFGSGNHSGVAVFDTTYFPIRGFYALL